MPTLLNKDIERLSVSKIDNLLKKAEGFAAKAENPVAQSSLLGDQKRLIDAKKKIIDFVTKEKRKADAGKTSAWVANWRTSITYGDVMKKKSGAARTLKAAGDKFTQSADFLEDHKQAIIATGATAAVAGAAINYLPKLMEMPTGNMIEVVGADGAKSMVQETVGMALKSFFKANPALTAGLGIAGLAALAVSIPTIRNKVRSSQSYQGKMQARKENAELKSDILDLDSTRPREAVNYYTNAAIKFDKGDELVIDEAIIDSAANPDVIKALEDDLKNLLSDATPHPQEVLKLQTLINRAKAKWQRVQEAEERARNRAENEAIVHNAVKETLDGFLKTPGAATALQEAEKLFKIAEAKKEAMANFKALVDEKGGDTVHDIGGTKKKLSVWYADSKTEFEAAEKAVTKKLGINMDNFRKPGTSYLLVGHLEAAQRVLNEAQKTATMGS